MNRLYQIIDVFCTISKQNQTYIWVFCIFLGLIPTLNADNLSDSIAQLNEISITLEKLEKEIENDQLSRKNLQLELVTLDRETNKLYKELAKFEKRRSVIDKNLIQLQKDKADLSAQLVEQNDKLQRQIRLAYLSNQQSTWRDLLNNAGTQRLGAKKQMYEYINNARLAEMKSLSDLAAKLSQTGEQLQIQQQELAELIALKAEQKAVLRVARRHKDQAQSLLNNRLVDTEERLKEEQKKQKKIQKLIKKLSKIKPSITLGGFQKAKGKMLWPVNGEALNQFGRVKDQNSDATWEGVATVATRGSKIRAIYNGQVIFADYLQGYGWLLILDHGDEFMSLYAHAEALMKDVGDKVASQDVIALVGDSGNVTSPTMYFEIRRQGAPVNPRAWCK